MDRHTCKMEAMEYVISDTLSKSTLVPMLRKIAMPSVIRNKNGSTHDVHMTNSTRSSSAPATISSVGMVLDARCCPPRRR